LHFEKIQLQIRIQIRIQRLITEGERIYVDPQHWLLISVLSPIVIKTTGKRVKWGDVFEKLEEKGMRIKIEE
jgi:hypothetical protein